MVVKINLPHPPLCLHKTSHAFSSKTCWGNHLEYLWDCFPSYCSWFLSKMSMKWCKEIQFCSASSVGYLLSSYVFQSAGGRPVLTVDLWFQSVGFISLPLYPCLPPNPTHPTHSVVFCVFLSLVDNSNTNIAQALKWKKRNNNNVQKDRKRIWSIVLQINFVLYLLCIMTLFKKKCTFSKTVN